MKNLRPSPESIRVVLLIVILTLITTVMFATPRVLPDAAGMKVKMSGSGLVPSPTFTANYTFSKCQFEIGFGIQTRHPHLSRIESTFYYTITGSKEERSHLVLFGNVDYNFDAFLRKKIVTCERRMNQESEIDFQSLRSSTIEYQTGFGMFVDATKQIHLFSGIGYGMYHTIGTPELRTSAYRERTACTLMLSAGIFFSFGGKTLNINSTL